MNAPKPPRKVETVIKTRTVMPEDPLHAMLMIKLCEEHMRTVAQRKSARAAREAKALESDDQRSTARREAEQQYRADPSLTNRAIAKALAPVYEVSLRTMQRWTEGIGAK